MCGSGEATMAKKVKIWQCSRCAYFRPSSKDNSYGECHRYPPKVAAKHSSGGERHVAADVFPRVSEANFCGEYQNKDFYKAFLEGQGV